MYFQDKLFCLALLEPQKSLTCFEIPPIAVQSDKSGLYPDYTNINLFKDTPPSSKQTREEVKEEQKDLIDEFEAISDTTCLDRNYSVLNI